MGKCSRSTVYAKRVVLLLGQSISREGRQFSKGKQSFGKTLVLESRVVYISMANNMSGKSFGGRVRVDEKRRAEENRFVLVHSECMREV